MTALSWSPESYDHPTTVESMDRVNMEIRSTLVRREHLQDREQLDGNEFHLL